jgi:phosphonate transport system permease protein
VSRRTVLTRVAYVALAVAAFLSLNDIGLIDAGVWRRGAENLIEFAGLLIPPDWSVLDTLIDAMLETIQMAFIGTLLGLLISLPLAVLGTRTLFGPAVTVPARLLVGAIRTVPALLWGVIFVVGFGLGPAAGALGVALYSVGYLGKLYYEAFEDVDSEVLEAVRATGANRTQLVVFAVLPESTNALVSHLLFMFDYNIRASSIMGFVGAGGIGFYILGYVERLQYEKLMTALILTFVVVMAVDYLSARLRSLMVPSMQTAHARAPLLAGATVLR